jgi:hypothetical protein
VRFRAPLPTWNISDEIIGMIVDMEKPLSEDYIERLQKNSLKKTVIKF